MSYLHPLFEDQSSGSLKPNRRSSVRHPYGREAACSSSVQAERRPWTATVHDLSLGGAGLVIGWELRAGELVEVELRDSSGSFGLVKLAQVAHARPRPVGEGGWFVGCSFVRRPLAESELRALLK